MYTLSQFTRPAPETGIVLPEEKLLKRYTETRKKEYLDLVKKSEKTATSSAEKPGQKLIEVKQTATRVTIEGQHVCLFILKRVPKETT